MTRFGKTAVALVLLAAVFGPIGGTTPTRAAGWGDVAKTVGMDLVGPLAANFGVPVAAVSALFQGGLSVEGVVQALLLSQTSKVPVGKVGSMLESNGNDMDATAKSLDVAPSAYSDDKVAAVLSEVQTSKAPATPSVPAAPAGEGAQKTLGGFLKTQ